MLITKAQAVAQGFNIDTRAPGRPIAYRGPSYAPTAVFGLFTSHEEELRATLEAIATLMDSEVQHLARKILDNPNTH